MTRYYLSALFIFCLLGDKAVGQDCSDLLKQGLREYTKVITKSDTYQEVATKVCMVYQEYRSTGNEVKANAGYKAIFKGDASYSKQQIEQIGKLYCEQNFELNSRGEYGEYQSSFIDPNLAKMYIECVKASNRNVNLELKPTDGQNQSITITASYLSTSSFRPKITGIEYNPELLKVDGKLKDAALSGGFLDGFHTLIAARKDLSNAVPFMVGNELVLAKSHQLVLQLENAAITINFPTIYPTPPKIELVKGVGEIVSSMLPVEKFLSLYGKKDWALADGSKTPEGSAYKLINETLPDLRGVFLRGKNHGRDAGSGNPDGDLALGMYSKDKFQNHTHPIKITTKTENYNRAILYRSEEYPSKTIEGEPSATGSSETSPRNVTVNYFIRIN